MSARETLPLEPYLTYWRRRRREQRTLNRQLSRRAWEDAAQIAVLLRREFGANQVIVFGSLARERFHPGSDVDLAVSGLAKEDFFPALAQASQMSQFHIDLKPLEDLDAHFKQRILATGREI
jgi:predicted nucleotidyltransferase